MRAHLIALTASVAVALISCRERSDSNAEEARQIQNDLGELKSQLAVSRGELEAALEEIELSEARLLDYKSALGKEISERLEAIEAAHTEKITLDQEAEQWSDALDKHLAEFLEEVRQAALRNEEIRDELALRSPLGAYSSPEKWAEGFVEMLNENERLRNRLSELESADDAER